MCQSGLLLHQVAIVYGALLLITRTPPARTQFYVGEYKTLNLTTPGEDEDINPQLQQDLSNEIDPDEHQSALQSRSLRLKSSKPKDRQGVFFSTFNPLTPGGTIYLAFIFLIPLTVGKHNKFGRGFSSSAGWIQRALEAVQRDGSLYNEEMGFIDGNRMIRKAWNKFRSRLGRPFRRYWRSHHQSKKKLRNNRTKKKKIYL